MPANHNIFIEDIENNGELKLSDKGKTDVNVEDTVTWIVEEDSGVKEITAITPDAGSENVFNPAPAPVGGSKKMWRGTVDPAKKGRKETYTIEYIAGNGTPSQFDPVIQVNP